MPAPTARRSGEHRVPPDDDDDSDQVPIDLVSTADPVQAIMLRQLSRVLKDLNKINARLANGENVIEAVRELPIEFALLKQTVDTLRTLVYGAVAIMLIGTLGTWGAAIIFFLKLH